MDLPKVGAFLKELRKAKKLTQEQLAEILNVSRRTVSRWETGTSVPDYDLLVEMADLYQVDLRELLDGEKKSAAASQELVKMKQWITAGLSLMAIFASRVPDGAEPLKVYYAG
ncbi:MAG: helix-turn-helix transcriptional regulator [Clostridia bacterium]|nr:helix-turn-helix transcriptional regulator [Clostridia bacterium]